MARREQPFNNWSPRVVTLAYGPNIATDVALGEVFYVEITDNVGFTFDIPDNPSNGKTITYIVRNNSGGASGIFFWDNFSGANCFYLSTVFGPNNGAAGYISQLLAADMLTVSWIFSAARARWLPLTAYCE